MSRDALPRPPSQLFGADGLAPFGNFAGPISDINVGDFDYTRLQRWPWTAWRRTARKLLKRWQFVGVIDENLVLGAAVAHVQYLGNGFAYVYERDSKTITEQALKAPFAAKTQFSPSPDRGETRMSVRKRSIVADNTLRGDARTLKVDCGDVIRAEVTFHEPGTGVSTACPQAKNGFHYTYKSAGLPASGRVWVKGREYALTDDALALFDWTASTPARRTTWNWSCGVGRDGAGQPIGLNFSRGLVGGEYSQNCVWLGGKPHMLGPVDFDYDRDDILGKPWRLTADDGALDLTFEPQQERFENINIGLVASALHQPFGPFSGTFDTGEERLSIELFGFCEQHYAKW